MTFKSLDQNPFVVGSVVWTKYAVNYDTYQNKKTLGSHVFPGSIFLVLGSEMRFPLWNACRDVTCECKWLQIHVESGRVWRGSVPVKSVPSGALKGSSFWQPKKKLLGESPPLPNIFHIEPVFTDGVEFGDRAIQAAQGWGLAPGCSVNQTLGVKKSPEWKLWPVRFFFGVPFHSSVMKN